MKTELEYILPFRRYSTRKTTIWRDISLLAVRIHSYGCWIRNVVQVSIRNSWCWWLHISETITITETWFAPFGSATLALGHCEKRNSNISYRFVDIPPEAQSPERDISLLFLFFFFFFLLFLLSDQKIGHLSPPTGMVRSWKFWHHIKARDRTKRISDFGAENSNSLIPYEGNQFPIINISDIVPHISCGRFPWKTERAGAGGSTHEKIVG